MTMQARARQQQQVHSRVAIVVTPARALLPSPTLARAALRQSGAGRARLPSSLLTRAAATDAPATTAADAGALWEELRLSTEAYAKAPPSEKLSYSSDVLDALKALKAAGEAPAWGSVFGPAAADGAAENNSSAAPQQLYARRSVLPGELRQAGIKSPDAIARPSVRNDAAFLATVVGVTSVAAVALGQLPGQWGFWGTYLSGGIAIVVLAVGSTAPGLLQFAIDKFSQIQPEYRQRVIDHGEKSLASAG